MIYGEVAVDDALGCILAHSVRAGQGRLSKGRRLVEADVELLRQSGILSVIAVRLDDGDVDEDDAAGSIASAISAKGLRLAPASTGRVNIFSTCDGLFRADRETVDAFNRIDPAITIACLKDCAEVAAGDMVATIKIIPLAVAGHIVRLAAGLLADRAPFTVKPYQPVRTRLIATTLPSLKLSVMDKTRELLRTRLQRSGSTLVGEVRVLHRAQAVANEIRSALSESDLVVVFGASAVADAGDVIPQAIRLAGGEVVQVGLPVDPGNLLVLGYVDGVPVIGAPGCARSPKENAFDWVLARIIAGDPPSQHDMTGWGVGGLLMEIQTRPSPRIGEPDEPRPLQVNAVVLAAGRATRMGETGKHKLLATFSGVPLIRKTVETVGAAGFGNVAAVTGYRADDIEQALEGLDIITVNNPSFAEGMAGSLKAGLAAVGADADGIMVVLGDMPALESSHLKLMLERFRAEEGRVIVRASHEGKRGNPVILPRATFSAIARLEGDIGARAIVETSGLPVMEIEIGPAAVIDTDTPEEIISAGGKLDR